MHALPLPFPLVFALPAKVRELSARGGEDAPEDAELVRRALGGERWAEEALYRRHVRVVARVVTRLLGRSDEAEDVVQDAFVSAFRDLGDLRQSQSFRAWLLQLAVHLVHRRFRRRALRRALGLDREQDDVVLAAQVDPHVDLDVRAEIAKLDDVLSELPAADRIAWVLRYVEHYRVDEIAEACRCSSATVKRRIQRVHRRVTQHLVIDVAEGT